jgi:hypothetical protein
MPADLQWYKDTLEKVAVFISKQIHPYYGSCDGFAGGECSECLRVLDALKSGTALSEEARSITTKEGHLIQRFDGVWYAYPKLDLMEGCTGGDAIMDASKRLVKFGSALEAYKACRDTWEKHGQRPATAESGALPDESAIAGS